MCTKNLKVGNYSEAKVPVFKVEFQKVVEGNWFFRDRDRVLIPETVCSLLTEKYNIHFSENCLDTLMKKFEDKEQFEGMTNYENLVRWW